MPIRENNPAIEKQIEELYLSKKPSMRDMEQEIGKSATYIRRVLTDIGIYDLENKHKKSTGTAIVIKNRFPIIEGFKYVAMCKKTNQKFDDYENKSGILKRHIEQEYPDYKFETKFKRASTAERTGKFWYEEFFDIKSVIDPKHGVLKSKCKYCDWTTVDLDNKSGGYTCHLQDIHNKGLDEYILEYPNDKWLFKTYFIKKEKQEHVESNEFFFVTCLECNKKFGTLTSTHLKIHNLNQEQYLQKYPNAEAHSEDFIKRTTELLAIAFFNAKNGFISKAEIAIGELLKENNINFDSRNKKLLHGTEIDIIVHEQKIGIEYNGCYYHSELMGKDKWFHIAKTNMMNAAGYQLIHIFEDEWEWKQEIIKSNILTILDITHNKKEIRAENCQIQEITPEEKLNFLEKNSIYGNGASNINIGLFYEKQLIFVMAFYNNNNGIFELKRFVSDINIICVEAEKILFDWFVKKYNPNKIFSLADKRWFCNNDNNIYTNLGFLLTEETEPDYKYINKKASGKKGIIRHNKSLFTKIQLKHKFPELYSEDKTEWEMMQEAGYNRIWDCGKYRYELTINPNTDSNSIQQF